ncbi:MAG: hypothetical protein RL298_678 [Pseudomonadota bacterium]|jgi:hypothetical protein
MCRRLLVLVPEHIQQGLFLNKSKRQMELTCPTCALPKSKPLFHLRTLN